MVPALGTGSRNHSEGPVPGSRVFRTGTGEPVLTSHFHFHFSKRFPGGFRAVVPDAAAGQRKEYR